MPHLIHCKSNTNAYTYPRACDKEIPIQKSINKNHIATFPFALVAYFVYFFYIQTFTWNYYYSNANITTT